MDKRQYSGRGYIADLPVNTVFYLNGNVWLKHSSRTIKLLENNRIYYYTKKEIAYYN